MKISYDWLKEYININLPVEELSEILTNIGLEVEGIETFETIKGGLKGVVIGEVLTCEKHPNADKLSKTTVNVGGETPLDIVCGAPNVAAGQKVLVATVGTTLYSGDESFTIKKAKIRGERSEGMICAEDELGLGTSHDGIMVLPENVIIGTAAADYFNIKSDYIFEIGLTPNRIDSASHYGVARDLAAYFALHGGKDASKPDVASFKVDNTSKAVDVSVENPEACKRYAGVTISGVKVAESPEWLQNRLKSIGLSPINNIVDITNFVLHELAQPLHAFDADKLNGDKIVVKKLPAETKFVTLDEEERKLHQDDLMICDAENPACIAGVFGGIHSGVTDKTTNIFLESAYFDAVHVRKTAKRHGLSTDASFRFERGIDPNITIHALKRAAILIKEIAGGEITSDITDIYPEPVQPFDITVKYKSIDRLIGKQLDRELMKSILISLEIEIVSESDEQLEIKVPPYRVDVTREADVIEDILRLYGYNNIDFSAQISSSIAPTVKPDNEKMVNLVSDMLAAQGFSEIMSNSLTREAYYTDLKTFPADKCVKILNPLSSDLSVMRQTLLFNGLEAISRNINHKSPDLRLFEYGRCYELKAKAEGLKKYKEEKRIGLFLTGKRESTTWNYAETQTSFFELKAHVQKIVAKLGVDTTPMKAISLESKDDLFAGGIECSVDGKTVAMVSVVSGAILKAFDIEQDVFFAELNWDLLLSKSGKTPLFQELPKYPAIRRDLALLIDEDVPFQKISDLSYQCEKKLIKEIGLFDFYKGKGVPDGKKSYGVNYTIQHPDKTLTDKEIDKIMNKIINRLKQELKAELR